MQNALRKPDTVCMHGRLVECRNITSCVTSNCCNVVCDYYGKNVYYLAILSLGVPKICQLGIMAISKVICKSNIYIMLITYVHCSNFDFI